MTDQIDQTPDAEVENIDSEATGPNRRRMFIAGAGLAGAAALVGKSGTASAADGGTFTGSTTTYVNDENVDTDPGNPGNEALVGEIQGVNNGSHAIRGNTLGDGHAVAGTVPSGNTNNTVAATWGKHDNGLGAGVGGVNGATDVDIAGPARGVEGIVINDSNGSHAVFGLTNGGGHSVAGDTPNDAGPDGSPNTVAATWGRHAGLGAGIGGVNTNEDGVDIAGSARGVEGVVVAPNNGSHAVFGQTFGGGHSVAGDTPADAAGPDGVGPNTTAATWGRHAGLGAGIGGINTGNGYGGEFIGGKASVRLIPQPDAETGPPTDEGHLRGELYVDGAGEFFFNSSDGNNWVPLTQGGAGGTVLFEDPARASDTRADSTPPNTDKTKYGLEETREVDLTLAGYPANASAAIINLTVVNSEGYRGFATIFNGDTADGDRPNTSNINWTASTGVIANSATVRPNADGVIKIYTSQPTDVIVDVQGYIA